LETTNKAYKDCLQAYATANVFVFVYINDKSVWH